MSTYRKLYRSVDNKKVAGVCAGIAEYMSLDPTLVRLLFIGLVFFGGFGIPIYLLMWAFVPRDPEYIFADSASNPGLVSLLFKALIVVISLGVITHNFGAGAGAVSFLIGLIVGLFFYWRSRRDDSPEGEFGISTTTRFYRSDSNKKILGVFGGLAEGLGVDARLLRIAGGVLLLVGFPVTVALYLLMGVLMPRRQLILHIE